MRNLQSVFSKTNSYNEKDVEELFLKIQDFIENSRFHKMLLKYKSVILRKMDKVDVDNIRNENIFDDFLNIKNQFSSIDDIFYKPVE